MSERAQQDAQPVEGELPDIDGNGRDLIRNLLREFGVEAPAEQADWLAEDLREHIVCPRAPAEPVEPEENFYHVEPGRGGVAVSFEYHDACREAAGLRQGQSLLEWIRARVQPDDEALTIAYQKGRADEREQARVQPRRVSREELRGLVDRLIEEAGGVGRGDAPCVEEARTAVLLAAGLQIEGDGDGER